MRRIQITIGAGIGIILLLWILQRIDIQELGAVLAQANYLYLFPAALVLLFSFWLRALRWKHILRPVKEVGLPHLFSGQVIGYFVNAVLFTNAGELVRIYTLARRTMISKSSLLATVVVERMLDVVAVFLLLLPIIILLPSAEGITRLEVIAGLLFSSLWIAIFFLAYQKERVLAILAGPLARASSRLGPKITRRLSLFMDGLKILLQGGGMVVGIFYSLLIWGTTTLSWFILGQSLNLGLSLQVYALPLGASFLASALPALPGRLGTFEFIVVWTLGFFSLGASEALALAILVRLYRLLPMAVGYFFLLREGLSWSEVRGGRPPDATPAS